MSSFFRGSRQDSSRDYRDRERDSRNGGGGGGRSNIFRNPATSRVSPWEGGVTPGSMSRPVGGLLPTPNLANAGLLQQLSTQEAQTQLAIASNMLSALLPSLQNSQANQVPSLLSLNPNRGGLLPLTAAAGPSFQGLGFPGQPPRNDNMGPNRHRPRPSNKRTEPYNKMVNHRSQRPGQKMDDRKGAGGPPRTGNRLPVVSPRKVAQQAKSMKQEDAKKSEARNDLEKKKAPEERGSVVEITPSAFADVPESMFNCHICNKRMWDATSFSNHLKGRAHQMMIDQLDDSYKIKIELMRHEMKVDEQQRQIEMERKQRQGKVIGSQTREYCTMCDLNFIGTLPLHRKSDLHQQLKSFLHPKCIVCSEEFPTRLEWDQHLLTPGHLKHSAGNRTCKQTKNNVGHEVKNSATSEKPKVEEVNLKMKVEPSDETTKVGTAKVVPLSETKKADVKQPTESVKSETQVKTEFVIPDYDASKEIGADMLQEKTGYLCRCCNRFISSENDAKTHCRSRYHYDRYVSHLKSVGFDFKPNQPKANDILSNPQKKTDLNTTNLKVAANFNDNNSPKVSNLVEKTSSVVKEAQGKDFKEGNNQKRVDHDEEEDREEDDVSWKRRKICKEEGGADEVNRVNSGATSQSEECPIAEANKGSMKEGNSDEAESRTNEDLIPKEAEPTVPGSDSTTLDETVSIKEDEDEGGTNTLEKLWKEIDADGDLGALLQAVDKDSQDALEETEENQKNKSLTEPSPRGRRGRGGSAVRSRNRKRK